MIKFYLKKKNGPARTCFRGGVTLLEALVAISILMVAVATPITIAQKGLSSATYSKNQMIASYLAQDAIEYIKNKRDEVSIKNKNSNTYAGWEDLTIFSKCFDSCRINTLEQEVDSAVSDDNPDQLLEKDNNGFYQYEDDANGITNFSRVIKIDRHNLGGATPKWDEALVTVTVSWGTDSVVVKTLIYNI